MSLQTRRALREIAEVLAGRYPHWLFEGLDAFGHMAPLTHVEQVNARLVEFLEEVPVAAPA